MDGLVVNSWQPQTSRPLRFQVLKGNFVVLFRSVSHDSINWVSSESEATITFDQYVATPFASAPPSTPSIFLSDWNLHARPRSQSIFIAN